MKRRGLKLIYEAAGILCEVVKLPAGVVGFVSAMVTGICEAIMEAMDDLRSKVNQKIYVITAVMTETE